MNYKKLVKEIREKLIITQEELAALGTVINLKPIITMKDGVVHAHSKTIGMKRALNYLVRNLEKMLLIIHFLLLLVIRII